MMLHTASLTIAGAPALPVFGLAASAVVFVRGQKRNRAPQRTWAFVAAWFVLAIALVSPLHRAAESQLYLHMVQHVLLMAVVAPLLVWSAPIGVLLRGIPAPLQRPAGRFLRATRRIRHTLLRPYVACLVNTVVLWAWHLPRAYDAGVEHEWVHALQHSSLLLAAIIFWASLPLHRHAGVKLMNGIASLFFTTLQMGILSALFTFSRVPWYSAYGGATANALANQHLAGLIMWVPGAFPYIAAALLMVWRLLNPSDARHLVAARPQVAPLRSHAAVMIMIAVAALSSTACDNIHYDEGSAIAHGNARRGQGLLKSYGCVACHTVRGVPSSGATVGPELNSLRKRIYIAGVMPNSPANLQKWIQNPKGVDSLTAMPVLGVTARDARDIASYLYSIR